MLNVFLWQDMIDKEMMEFQCFGSLLIRINNNEWHFNGLHSQFWVKGPQRPTLRLLGNETPQSNVGTLGQRSDVKSPHLSCGTYTSCSRYLDLCLTLASCNKGYVEHTQNQGTCILFHCCIRHYIPACKKGGRGWVFRFHLCLQIYSPLSFCLQSVTTYSKVRELYSYHRNLFYVTKIAISCS
jgi:hypothetical protein